MSIKRGDIFYIHRFQTYGSEQHPGRPGIVVSNHICNKNSQVIEVVYLTCQEKAPLPTHVSILSTGKESTALCEQITSVDIDKVGDYIGHLTEGEMQAVDAALLISLGLVDAAHEEVSLASTPEEEALMARIALKYVENYVRKTQQDSKK